MQILRRCPFKIFSQTEGKLPNMAKYGRWEFPNIFPFTWQHLFWQYQHYLPTLQIQIQHLYTFTKVNQLLVLAVNFCTFLWDSDHPIQIWPIMPSSSLTNETFSSTAFKSGEETLIIDTFYPFNLTYQLKQ